MPPRSPTWRRPLQKMREPWICVWMPLYRMSAKPDTSVRPNAEQTNRRGLPPRTSGEPVQPTLPGRRPAQREEHVRAHARRPTRTSPATPLHRWRLTQRTSGAPASGGQREWRHDFNKPRRSSQTRSHRRDGASGCPGARHSRHDAATAAPSSAGTSTAPAPAGPADHALPGGGMPRPIVEDTHGMAKLRGIEGPHRLALARRTGCRPAAGQAARSARSWSRREPRTVATASAGPNGKRHLARRRRRIPELCQQNGQRGFRTQHSPTSCRA